jgi:crossover junction endodeoxyribonuclease RusA
MIVLDLPRPPSVNALYSNVPGKGRIKTPAYRAWIEEAGWLLRTQRPKRLEGEYKLHVLVGPTRADIDNLAKAINDLLQKHGVVTNDRKADSVHLERTSLIPKGIVRCTVTPAAQEHAA